MILRLFGRAPRQATTGALYGAIVAQSRRPLFYSDYGVPDTVDGRFDLIVLHQALLGRRLAREADHLRALVQDVFDMFCRDLDDNLREMGVGDLTVPKEMQRFAAAYYGRVAAYDQALDAGDGDALARALARNVLAEAGEPSVKARRLAAYVTAALAGLDAVAAESFIQGRLPFPDPEAGAAPTTATSGKTS
jgi:cytochrome b pre-mRNA-processing protein 3